MKKILMIGVLMAASSAFAQTNSTQTTQTQTQTTQTQETQTTETQPATETQTTETQTTETQSTESTDTGTLTAEQLFQRAQEQAAQAEIAYPVAFVDRTLWKAAVTDAAAAATAEPNNRNYVSYLAQLYTKTQWWINAYNTWMRLGELTEQERDLASLSAAKLAYLALQGGNRDLARQYVTQGQTWRNTQSLQDIANRLGQ